MYKKEPNKNRALLSPPATKKKIAEAIRKPEIKKQSKGGNWHEKMEWRRDENTKH